MRQGDKAPREKNNSETNVDALAAVVTQDALNTAGNAVTALADLVAEHTGDRLLGGAGDDRLDGGLGDDLLFGNEGSDVFVFGADGVNYGNDTVKDFIQGDDIFDFSGLTDGTGGALEFADLTIMNGAAGGAIEITITDNADAGTLTIDGYEIDDLTLVATDFDFA